MEKIISFRYDGERTLAVHEEFYDRIASRFQLRVSEKVKKYRQVVTEGDLVKAETVLFDDVQVEKMKRAGQIPLGTDRTTAVTRKVHYERRSYVSAGGDVCMAVTFSNDNDFPAIGVSVWQDEELRLPGGYFVVSGTNVEVVETILTEISRFLSGQE